jgi:hypothetical protein
MIRLAGPSLHAYQFICDVLPYNRFTAGFVSTSPACALKDDNTLSTPTLLLAGWSRCLPCRVGLRSWRHSYGRWVGGLCLHVCAYEWSCQAGVLTLIAAGGPPA